MMISPSAGLALLLGAVPQGVAAIVPQAPPSQATIVTRGPTDARRLALVFTGHEFADGAMAIPDTLEAHSAKASFFLTGDFPEHRGSTRVRVDELLESAQPPSVLIRATQLGYPPAGRKSAVALSTYRSEETTWADDMEWGAAELYRATGKERYLEEAKHYAEKAGAESWMGREQAAHYRFYPFMNLGHFRLHALVDRSIRRRLEAFYREGLERCAASARGHPYGVGVPFIWCSNKLVTALATQCLLYERMTGDCSHRALAARQRDWLLGRNPWGYTMFTGIGQVFPTDVHLMTTHLTGRSVRGSLVDGPVYERIFQSLRGVAITEPDPLAPFQDPRAVYHNDFKDYATDEPTMDGTASAILLWILQSTQS